MIDVAMLEEMRVAAYRAALGVVGESERAHQVAQEVVAHLIRRGIADLVDPLAHAAACGEGWASVRAA